MAWLIWPFIHLMYIVEFQSRIQVFIQWGFEYLTFSRAARLITGPMEAQPKLQSKLEAQPKSEPKSKSSGAP